ncbi:uncharacterized protein LOC116802309 [Drosophila sechellia]|uniref:uncharacterized protein LOC116802309 n=1 Tax=Drosophila sechellia TaxID=7238 RepID=UPI0013DDC125|nr:uncharacterized protein LOC116802309 [Drosophila sechellia]
MTFRGSYSWMFSEDIQLRTEFKFYNIISRNQFRDIILQQCHKNHVTGYIVFTHRGKRAFGVMDGKRKDLNLIKHCLLSFCIPEPFKQRATFSAYELCFNPNEEKFNIKNRVPKGTKFLGDIYEDCFLRFKNQKPEPGEETEETKALLAKHADFFTSKYFANC